MSRLVVSSLRDYLEIVMDFERKMQTESANEGLWYRGIDDKTLSLSPGLFWKQFKSEIALTADFLALAPQ